MPYKKEFDYTVSFWFRSHRNLLDFERDFGDKKAYLFDLGGPSCYILNAKKLVCDPDASVEFDLSELPDFQAWIHLTYSANHAPGTFTADTSKSYVRIDCSGFTRSASGSYAAISEPKAYYGIDANLTQGFDGDLREFYVRMGYTEDADEIESLRHRAKVVDLSVLGYYKFDQEGFRWLND